MISQPIIKVKAPSNSYFIVKLGLLVGTKKRVVVASSTIGDTLRENMNLYWLIIGVVPIFRIHSPLYLGVFDLIHESY